jgi:anti-sigma B factor antagonist
MRGEFALWRFDGQEGMTVLSINGEHDLSTASELRRRLDELISTGEPFVVDLSPTSFIDSSIMRVILNARGRAVDAGLGFEVAQGDGSQTVARVLEVTGLRAQLPVHGTVAEAASHARTALRRPG